MEILHRGIKPEEHTYTGTCRGCGSVIRAEHWEIKHQSCQREGDWHEAPCPVCEGRVFFDRDKPQSQR